MFKQHGETPSLTTGPSAVNYDLDLYPSRNQFRTTELENDLVQELSAPPMSQVDKGQDVSLESHLSRTSGNCYNTLIASQNYDSLIIEWDPISATRPECMDHLRDRSIAQSLSDIVEGDAESCSSTTVTNMAASPHLNCKRGQEPPYRGSWAYTIGLHNVMQQGSLLKEERRIVKPAIARLCIDMSAGCALLDPTVRSKCSRQKVWQLCLNEEWRNAGIKGEGEETAKLNIEER